VHPAAPEPENDQYQPEGAAGTDDTNQQDGGDQIGQVEPDTAQPGLHAQQSWVEGIARLA
jgi:hypothetical protein